MTNVAQRMNEDVCVLVDNRTDVQLSASDKTHTHAHTKICHVAETDGPVLLIEPSSCSYLATALFTHKHAHKYMPPPLIISAFFPIIFASRSTIWQIITRSNSSRDCCCFSKTFNYWNINETVAHTNTQACNTAKMEGGRGSNVQRCTTTSLMHFFILCHRL